MADMGKWVKLMVKFAVCWSRGRRDLALENLALRQQLMVLQRNSKRPQFKDTDRLFWVLYSRAADGWQKVLLIARPERSLIGRRIASKSIGLGKAEGRDRDGRESIVKFES